jgi:hypothetical protein
MRWIAGQRSLICALCFILTAQLALVLTPTLVDRAPLLLLGLRPQPEMVVLLAGQVSPMAIVALVVPLRWLLHMTYVELGRWAGDAVLTRSRSGRWLRSRLKGRRVLSVLLASCLLHLGTPVDLALGAGGVDRRRAAMVVAAGSLISTVLFVTAGWYLAPVTEALLEWIVEHRVAASLAGAVLGVVGLLTGLRLLRAPRDGAPGDQEPDRS